MSVGRSVLLVLWVFIILSPVVGFFYKEHEESCLRETWSATSDYIEARNEIRQYRDRRTPKGRALGQAISRCRIPEGYQLARVREKWSFGEKWQGKRDDDGYPGPLSCKMLEFDFFHPAQYGAITIRQWYVFPHWSIADFDSPNSDFPVPVLLQEECGERDGTNQVTTWIAKGPSEEM